MIRRAVIVACSIGTIPALLAGQRSTPRPPGLQGSSNVHVLSHLPLGRIFTVSDVEIEQELSRPYVYVSRMMGYRSPAAGFDIIDIRNPAK